MSNYTKTYADVKAWDTMRAALARPAAVASFSEQVAAETKSADRTAIRLLVAAGFITEEKANEALCIAHGFSEGPLAPPAAQSITVPAAGAYFAGLDYTGRPIYHQAEQAPPASSGSIDTTLADTQRAIIEAAERRGYERGLSEAEATLRDRAAGRADVPSALQSIPGGPVPLIQGGHKP